VTSIHHWQFRERLHQSLHGGLVGAWIAVAWGVIAENCVLHPRIPLAYGGETGTKHLGIGRFSQNSPGAYLKEAKRLGFADRRAPKMVDTESCISSSRACHSTSAFASELPDLGSTFRTRQNICGSSSRWRR
jgi:hypothetical protein